MDRDTGQRAAVRETERQVPGPDDDYGQPTWIDVEDDVNVELEGANG